MSTKKIEIQDNNGNIYYPHTDSTVVKQGDSTIDKITENIIVGADNKPAFEYLTIGKRGTGTIGVNSLASGSANVASGLNSQAEGNGTIASGTSSHAEGYGTIAGPTGTVNISSDATVGYFSHAEGNGTKASGNSAHSEGINTTASGIASHVEGIGNISSGNYSHSEGQGTIASGSNSHAEGLYAQSKGDHSHAQGYNVIAQGTASHVEGARGVAINTASHVEGDGCWAGQTAHAEGYGTFSGTGTPYKITAFNNTNKTVTLETVAGLAVGSALQVRRIPANDVLLYNVLITAISGSVVTLNTTATIDSTWHNMILISDSFPAHAEGWATMALGANSHAEGSGTYSAASSSHAEGQNTISSGAASHAEGDRAVAIGTAAHAEGTVTTATGTASHSEGSGTYAAGAYSHSEGGITYAYSHYSHAEGQSTQAGGSPTDASIGQMAHAEGYQTKASGQSTHAEGHGSIALGNQSHAEGYMSTASGEHSHAQGYATKAVGNAAFSCGSTSEANGDRSFAHGLAVKANGYDQVVFGRYNVPDNSALLIIGKGTSEAARSNAFIILADGTISSAGHCYSLVTASNITMVSGFTPTEGCVTERSGRHVELQLWVAGSIAANTPTVIGNIPNVIDRPTRPIRGTCIGGNGAIGWLVIYTDGNIQVNFPSAQGSFAGHSSYFSNY